MLVWSDKSLLKQKFERWIEIKIIDIVVDCVVKYSDEHEFILMKYVCAVTVDWLRTLWETEKRPFVLVVCINLVVFFLSVYISIKSMNVNAHILILFPFTCSDIYVKSIICFVNNAKKNAISICLPFHDSYLANAMFG